MDIHDTLNERQKVHGSFETHSQIAQALKRVMHAAPNWSGLSDAMKEALEMDAHKTARILGGNPSHHDHWHDKIGYITLVADTLAPCGKRWGILGVACNLTAGHTGPCTGETGR